jgi:hypothetical protein
MHTDPQKQPTPRGTQADGIENGKIYLVKYASTLRATYQIKLLAFNAKENGMQLVLVVRRICRFHPALVELIKANPDTILRAHAD